MSQRLLAACLAVPAVVALLAWATFGRLPYATYQPGETLDVLGELDGKPIVEVADTQTYDDDGQLRMTTVRVSPAQEPDERGQGLSSLMAVWLDGDSAVYPYEYVHEDDETQQSNREEGQLQMATSQETAVEVAMREAGIEVPQTVAVAAVADGSPADGKLEVDDVLRTIDGEPLTDTDQLLDAVEGTPPGQSLRLGISRDGQRSTVRVEPAEIEGAQRIGITPDVLRYDFPFDVRININPAIGGPSAGLVFSLAVYDELTPGSLTGGRSVAGTGEIYPTGEVGPIGGIEQKIAGARDDGAQLFLVPVANCADALAAGNNGDMRLMMATTMHDVRVALDRYAQDPDADLPSCEDADQALEAAS